MRRENENFRNPRSIEKKIQILILIHQTSRGKSCQEELKQRKPNLLQEKEQ